MRAVNHDEMNAHCRENIRRAILDMAYRMTSRAGMRFDFDTVMADIKERVQEEIDEYNDVVRSVVVRVNR